MISFSQIIEEIRVNDVLHHEPETETRPEIINTHIKLMDHYHRQGVTSRQEAALKGYTNSSPNLNNNLVNGKHDSVYRSLRYAHNNIKDVAYPSGHDFHVYSGVKNDGFLKTLKDHNTDIVHSPAHISASLNYHVAKKFTDNEANHKHIFKIRIRPHDKMVYAEPFSDYSGENHGHESLESEKETIIPSGTSLRYLGTTTHKHTHYDEDVETHIHDFEIHSQHDDKKRFDIYPSDTVKADNNFHAETIRDKRYKTKEDVETPLTHEDVKIHGHASPQFSALIDRRKGDVHGIHAHGFCSIGAFDNPHFNEVPHHIKLGLNENGDEYAHFHITPSAKGIIHTSSILSDNVYSSSSIAIPKGTKVKYNGVYTHPETGAKVHHYEV